MISDRNVKEIANRVSKARQLYSEQLQKVRAMLAIAREEIANNPAPDPAFTNLVKELGELFDK